MSAINEPPSTKSVRLLFSFTAEHRYPEEGGGLEQGGGPEQDGGPEQGGEPEEGGGPEQCGEPEQGDRELGYIFEKLRRVETNGVLAVEQFV